MKYAQFGYLSIENNAELFTYVFIIKTKPSPGLTIAHKNLFYSNISEIPKQKRVLKLKPIKPLS